jgi:DMSO/TMAO reductase YedYZ molybdopterin-dependent catalytic subunit
VGFFDRNRSQLEAQGIDPSRLPPGQYATDRFPVLHVGDVPRYASDLSDWDLRITGLVEQPLTLDFDELRTLPTVEETFDIHCVTKWSKFDTRWTGVRLTTLIALAGVRSSATHLVQHAEFGYTTNLPLDAVQRDDVLVAWAFDGEPLEPEHGYPVRLVLPHRYFWKSAKWLRGLELVDADRPGFWEQNGYHNDGDPFLEQRHWGD